MAEHLSLHEVAFELGVHYMTIYRYVRLGLLPATKVGGMWQVRPVDLEKFRSHAAQKRAAGPNVKRSRVDWPRRYGARLIAGDLVGGWSVIEAAEVAGKSQADVYLDVMAPAMHHLGERWRSQDADIDEEHHATTIVRRHIGRLSPQFMRRGRSRGTVLLGCVQGEHHDIGLSMVGDMLRAAAYDVVDLGADVPVAVFTTAAEKLEGDLVAVGLSLHTPELASQAAEVTANLQALVSPPLVIVGGHGVTDLGPQDLCPGCVISDARSMAQVVDTYRLARVAQ